MAIKMDNYDEANIADIEKAWEKEKSKSKAKKRKVYTMIQSNAPCKVEITEESRRLCAKALLK